MISNFGVDRTVADTFRLQTRTETLFRDAEEDRDGECMQKENQFSTQKLEMNFSLRPIATIIYKQYIRFVCVCVFPLLVLNTVQLTFQRLLFWTLSKRRRPHKSNDNLAPKLRRNKVAHFISHQEHFKEEVLKISLFVSFLLFPISFIRTHNNVYTALHTIVYVCAEVKFLIYLDHNEWLRQASLNSILDT